MIIKRIKNTESKSYKFLGKYVKILSIENCKDGWCDDIIWVLQPFTHDTIYQIHDFMISEYFDETI